MKKWYNSKTVWMGVLATLSGALSVGTQYLEEGSFGSQEGLMLLAFGLIGVVVRVWFTDKAIQ